MRGRDIEGGGGLGSGEEGRDGTVAGDQRGGVVLYLYR